MMAHPTDDELEAVAQRLELVGPTDVEAVDMLRACKGRDAPYHSEWNAAIEAAARENDCGCDGACMWPHACPKEDIEAIRKLKKGPSHD